MVVLFFVFSKRAVVVVRLFVLLTLQRESVFETTLSIMMRNTTYNVSLSLSHIRNKLSKKNCFEFRVPNRENFLFHPTHTFVHNRTSATSFLFLSFPKEEDEDEEEE